MKSKGLLKTVAIAWIVISIMAIVVRLPFGEDKSFLNGQFWTYIVASLINLIAAILLLIKGKALVLVSSIIIGLTYIATEIAARLTHVDVALGSSIASAILPIIFIILFYKGKSAKA